MGNVGVAHVDHYYQGSYRCYYVTPCCGEDVAELQKQTLISLKHKISKPKKELNWDQGLPLSEFTSIHVGKNGLVEKLDLESDGVDAKLEDFDAIFTDSLEVFKMGHNPHLEGNLDTLKPGLRLKHVDLSHCVKVEGSIEALKGCSMLKRVCLGSTKITAPEGVHKNSYGLRFDNDADCEKLVEFLQTLP